MAIKSLASRTFILPPYRMGAAQTRHYQHELNAMLRNMTRDLIASLEPEKRPHRNVAMDAQNLAPVARSFDRLNKRWIEAWSRKAPMIAAQSVGRFAMHADRQFMSALSQSGFEIQFRPTATLTNKIRIAAEYNTSLIKSVGTQYLDEVANLATLAASRGGDSAALAKSIRERYHVTKSRAALIARDQNAKITATVTNERRAECGLFYARWHHGAGVRQPRPSHYAAGMKGLVFDIRQGAFLDQKWVQPGSEINCHCSSSTIIPALDGTDPMAVLESQRP